MRYNGNMKTQTLSPDTRLENYLPRLVALSLLAVLLLLALAGCKNTPRTTAAIHPAGVYTLISVDGKSVPCNLTHEGVAMIVKSGSFIINAEGDRKSVV